MKATSFIHYRRYLFIPLLFPIVLGSGALLILNDPISRMKQQRLTNYDFVIQNISSRANIKLTYEDLHGEKLAYIAENGKELIDHLSTFEVRYSQQYCSDSGQLVIGDEEYSIGFYRNYQYVRVSRLAEFGFLNRDTFTSFYQITLEYQQEIFDLTSNFWTSIKENGTITHE